jgi:3-deoxy-D-manno-octulosonic-acid transferase
MGEINNYIALSDLVFVGGSIGDYGSQNPIEPLLMGKPTVVGQSTHNFFSIIKEAILAKIIYQIEIANLSFFIEKFSESGDDLNYQKNIKTFLDKNKKGEEKIISLISKYL